MYQVVLLLVLPNDCTLKSRAWGKILFYTTVSTVYQPGPILARGILGTLVKFLYRYNLFYQLEPNIFAVVSLQQTFSKSSKYTQTVTIQVHTGGGGSNSLMVHYTTALSLW